MSKISEYLLKRLVICFMMLQSQNTDNHQFDQPFYSIFFVAQRVIYNELSTDDNNNNKMEVSVSSVPGENKVLVSSSSNADQSFHVVIYDVSGKQLKKVTVRNGDVIILPRVRAGVYLFDIHGANSKVRKLKTIIKYSP